MAAVTIALVVVIIGSVGPLCRMSGLKVPFVVMVGRSPIVCLAWSSTRLASAVLCFALRESTPNFPE